MFFTCQSLLEKFLNFFFCLWIMPFATMHQIHFFCFIVYFYGNPGHINFPGSNWTTQRSGDDSSPCSVPNTTCLAEQNHPPTCHSERAKASRGIFPSYMFYLVLVYFPTWWIPPLRFATVGMTYWRVIPFIRTGYTRNVAGDKIAAPTDTL